MMFAVNIFILKAWQVNVPCEQTMTHGREHKAQAYFLNHFIGRTAYQNKNAFQWDAYCPLADHIPACTGRECVCPCRHWAGVGVGMSNQWVCLGGVCQKGCLSREVSAQGVGVWQTPPSPGPEADTPTLWTYKHL